MSHRSFIEETMDFLSNWEKEKNGFQKPQFIKDSEQDAKFYKNFHENIHDPTQLVKSMDADFNLNPTHFATIGPDTAPHVTPEFSDGPMLRELHALKIALHNLEDKINAAFGLTQESEEKKLRREVTSIRSKIDELSNKIAPHPVDDKS
jgi:hypothetical protein